MIAEFSALATTVKMAYEIAKGINSLKTDVDRKEAISKVLEILLSAQVQVISVNNIAHKLQEEKYNLHKNYWNLKSGLR